MVLRKTKKLSAVQINAMKAPGYYSDGDGLYLQVSKSGTKSWILRFQLNGRSREAGLGSVNDRTLSEAREEARLYRLQLRDGIDPIEHRKTKRDANLENLQRQRTFEQCAKEYHQLHAGGWKNAKHAAQWINTLQKYAFPIFGGKDVSQVSKGDILTVLEPIWSKKQETASRVKQRIKVVLDWASALEYRKNHDPHLWAQVMHSLPKLQDTSSHFKACPYSDIYQTIQSIKACPSQDGIKLAIEFLILTAARSGEIRFATWSEIDFPNKRWIIPKERMKAKREHRVPLSSRAIEILEIQRNSDDAHPVLIFPSKKGKAYSDMTFSQTIKRLGYSFHIHGFRSTFRDWAAEQTAYPREICEAALAHTNPNSTEAAYFHSDLFEKRRDLMKAWDEYCSIKRSVVGLDMPLKTAA